MPNILVVFTPSEVDQLRLAAALVRGAVDGELELVGEGRRWLVSRRRPYATVDPCGFRQLVLATVRGCRVGLQPVRSLRFVGGLVDIGGGVYESTGPNGSQRRVATFLPAIDVEAVLRTLPDDDARLHAHVVGDAELGATVVTLSLLTPTATGLWLDAAAQSVAAACMVEEVIAPVAPSRP